MLMTEEEKQDYADIMEGRAEVDIHKMLEQWKSISIQVDAEEYKKGGALKRRPNSFSITSAISAFQSISAISARSSLTLD